MFCPKCGTPNPDEAQFCGQCGAPLTVEAAQTAASVPRARSYAGFWMRVAAALVDALIMAIPSIPIRAVFGHDFFSPGTVFSVVIGWLYFALLESSPNQATLGKMALGIYVTDLDGRRISFGRATGRHFGKYLSAVILGIGFMMAGFTEKKQALHDILADTLVVRK